MKTKPAYKMSLKECKEELKRIEAIVHGKETTERVFMYLCIRISFIIARISTLKAQQNS